MRKAACYCRVSTRKDDQLDSLEKQREFFQRFFDSNSDYCLYELYADEGISGKSLRNRAAFAKMLRDAQEGKFEAVFVKDVSRFARNVQDFYYALDLLEKHNVKVHFVTMNLKSEEASRFTLGLMALLAEDESQRLSVKVKFGKTVTARRGRVPNFVFGYERVDNYTLKPHPQEADWVRRIFYLYTREGMGSARIAQWLNHMGVVSKRGSSGKWTQSTVVKLLRNPLYVGNVVNLRTEVQDFKTARRMEHPKEKWVTVRREDFRLIDQDVFNEAQNLLSSRADSFAGGRRQSNAYPLSNLLRCGEDDRSFRRLQRRGRSYWVCSHRNANGAHICPNDWQVDEGEMHMLLLGWLRHILQREPKAVQSIVRRAEELAKVHRDGQNYQSEKDELAEKKRRLYSLFADGLIGREELASVLAPILLRLDEIELLLTAQKKVLSPCMDFHRQATLYIEGLETNGLLDNVFLKDVISHVRVEAQGRMVLCLGDGEFLLAQGRRGS